MLTLKYDLRGFSHAYG